ncbi:hypothetical protein D1115_03630 [Vibrio alfacsensis]|uniref:Uncharacterized protein n=1 Tax=Vibrio alfacsensis TaxID=1074311 RepID=A0ABM6YS91_9VIBR|nr:hypothetical protein [Vibrio alfacsensis]AXY00456.1 hypothetical protein D1115_03630 [Vibrio alfacsensis]
MKKSILSTMLLASLSASVFAADTGPIADTVTWTGTVPAIVAANDEMYIKDLTGLDNGVLSFERAADGALSMLPTELESFEVRSVTDDSAKNYTVTLASIVATAGAETLPAGSFVVKQNGTALAVNTASASVIKSDFTLEMQDAGKNVLQAKENVEVKVVANLTVAAAAAAL